MALFRSESSSSRRSRQERFLRYILRRKQCYIILLIEFIFLFSLTLFLFLLLWLMKNQMKEIEIIQIENDWKKSEEEKIHFHECEYESIWEQPEEMNYDLCKDHYGPGAQIWTLQETITKSTNCIPKIHMVPCHKYLIEGPASKIYDEERQIPASCGGLYGTPIPFEYVTPETDIRAPQVSNEMLGKNYMHRNILATALHVKCPRCYVKSSWYASPISLHCRRQLSTLRHGWPYIAKYCDLEEETVLNLDKMIYC